MKIRDYKINYPKLMQGLSMVKIKIYKINGLGFKENRTITEGELETYVRQGWRKETKR